MRTREADGVEVHRLGPHDRDMARATFALMASVFGESHARLADAYVEALLSRPDFWALDGTPTHVTMFEFGAHDD